MNFLDEVIREATLAREEVIKTAKDYFNVDESIAEDTSLAKDYQKIIRLSHELKALLEKHHYEV